MRFPEREFECSQFLLSNTQHKVTLKRLYAMYTAIQASDRHAHRLVTSAVENLRLLQQVSL